MPYPTTCDRAATRQDVIDLLRLTPTHLVSRARIQPEGRDSYLTYLTPTGVIKTLLYAVSAGVTT